MDQVKAVVFDIGATLVEGPPVAPARVIAKALNIENHKIISNIIMCHDFADSSDLISVLQKKLNLTVSDEACMKISTLWDSQFFGCKELNSSGKVLRYINEKGIKIALISDIWRPYYEGVKKAIPDIEKLAPVRILSFQTGHKKPERYNFELLLERLQVSPSEAVVVGDTYNNDIEPAINMGMKTVWLWYRKEKEADSISAVESGLKCKPSITINNINELYGII